MKNIFSFLLLWTDYGKSLSRSGMTSHDTFFHGCGSSNEQEKRSIFHDDELEVHSAFAHDLFHFKND